MPDGGVSWLYLAGLELSATRIVSVAVNNLSFLHQLTNELADSIVAHYITHTIHPYNIILIHAFLLVIELQTRGRISFALAERLLFDSNSAANRALGLCSLLSHSFTLYYFTLQ
jgi:hypothetical protein